MHAFIAVDSPGEDHFTAEATRHLELARSEERRRLDAGEAATPELPFVVCSMDEDGLGQERFEVSAPYC
ncbi:hypothetical protein TeGR_g12216 [Tetraparma gracilis]|uniref:Uncharacterized protein n=1 Tax=Tetraparma gracilis TaxID=2962635 RepID=A0ABQ6MAB7_9STRA|nr:hypothetical protein TeGR_g12216 [Tetraparma gracilis]